MRTIECPVSSPIHFIDRSFAGYFRAMLKFGRGRWIGPPCFLLRHQRTDLAVWHGGPTQTLGIRDLDPGHLFADGVHRRDLILVQLITYHIWESRGSRVRPAANRAPVIAAINLGVVVADERALDHEKSVDRFSGRVCFSADNRLTNDGRTERANERRASVPEQTAAAASRQSTDHCRSYNLKPSVRLLQKLCGRRHRRRRSFK